MNQVNQRHCSLPLGYYKCSEKMYIKVLPAAIAVDRSNILTPAVLSVITLHHRRWLFCTTSKYFNLSQKI